MDAARVIRSKNAGPLHLTLDLMFEDRARYDLACASPALEAGAIARLYGVSGNLVQVIPYPAALAIKVVIERPVVAGSPGDADVYGAQQHRPLLGIEL
ncbi:DUF4387 domain-containing protein [Falsiroseomonas sp. CW058]|uniref:DUF4387 domain-containing protein n=1 Tax=Falsiroseomonas sp. CW058 TaxID=3388664 RepID=UPI003D31991B